MKLPSLEYVRGILQQPLWGNRLQEWLIAVLVAMVTLVTLLIVRSVVRRRLIDYATKFNLRLVRVAAALAAQTRISFLLVLAVYCGSLVVDLSLKATLILNTATILVVLLQAALWGHAFLTFAVADYKQRRLPQDAAAVTTVTALGFLGKLVLWSLVILLSLDNVGVNVTTLIAGLGIGGIAVALAAQTILGDLFASLSIVLDKPFVLGDVIAVGNFTGTVEQIGVKTTRVRSTTGEQLVFANNELLKNTIRNFKRPADRRVTFTVEVAFHTRLAKLQAIPAIIRQAIETQQLVRIERVHFKAIGPSNFVFEVAYIVLSADYNQYMDIQQAINLAILERFEQEQIQFAYPTQTIFLQQPNERSTSREKTPSDVA